MAVDYARYLQCVDFPSEDPQLRQRSSCPLFGSTIFVTKPDEHGWDAAPESPIFRRANSAGTLGSPTFRRAMPVPKVINEKCKRNVPKIEVRQQRLEKQGPVCSPHSCLRKCQHEERSPSVQNHWAASHGLAPNLASQLGRSLTLHTSPRIKRKGKQKKVKFADDYGETLVTFNIVPKIEFPDTGYWSFIEQAICDREYFQDFSGEDVDDEEDDFNEVSSPDDIAFPWHVQFEFPPKAPAARRDSQDSVTSSESTSSTCSFSFEQPAADFSAFQKKLEENYVCLENVKIDPSACVVTCSIKVKNLNPTKRVIARCSSDNWATYADLHATYVDPGYECNVYDTFSFAITKPPLMGGRARVEFAILYEVNGQTFWDNNSGENYIIEWCTTPMNGLPE